MILNLSYLFILIIFVSSLYTILSTNSIRSILFLILTFINSALLLIFLGLDFIGLSLIIIYIGAVAILFLFVIMLINYKEIETSENIIKYLGLGVLIIYNVYIILLRNLKIFKSVELTNVTNSDWTLVSSKRIIEKIGFALFTENFLNFLFIGIILLLAIFIVIYLGSLKTKVKNQDLFNQIQS